MLTGINLSTVSIPPEGSEGRSVLAVCRRHVHGHLLPLYTQSSHCLFVCLYISPAYKDISLTGLKWKWKWSRVRLFATPWTVAHQTPPSVGFSRQEYWSGLPFPSPGDLPNPGIEPRSSALQEDSLPSEPTGKPVKTNIQTQTQEKYCHQIEFAFPSQLWTALLFSICLGITEILTTRREARSSAMTQYHD